MTWETLLAIFIGGGTGATCRYGIGRFVGERYDGEFPLGTVIINVTGCFALGLLTTALATLGTLHRDTTLLTALLATGFLGGYTTFSTYALEGVLLYNDGSRRLALSSLLGPLVAGLIAAGVGAAVGRAV